MVRPHGTEAVMCRPNIFAVAADGSGAAPTGHLFPIIIRYATVSRLSMYGLQLRRG